LGSSPDLGHLDLGLTHGAAQLGGGGDDLVDGHTPGVGVHDRLVEPRVVRLVAVLGAALDRLDPGRLVDPGKPVLGGFGRSYAVGSGRAPPPPFRGVGQDPTTKSSW